MFNAIVAMLINEATGRFHPILFYESPLPGNPENLVRHKSKGHHTAGFDTRAEAEVAARELAERQQARLALSQDLPWDGEDIPAMVAFFIEGRGDELVRAM
jgi:hypothetical protein